jgi:multicomponent Na+:H+ antiporter subunit G
MSVSNIIASVFLLIGGLFSLVAALGIFRFKDFYSRVHAVTKASTFGFGFAVISLALTFSTVSAWAKVLAAIVFLFATLPIGAHLLSRAFLSKKGEDRKS